MLVLGLLSSLLGCVLGYAAQEGLAVLLADLMPTALPMPSALPVLTGLATGLVTLLGFGLPPLIRLRDVPPSRVLRRDLTPLPTRGWLVYGSAHRLYMLIPGLDLTACYPPDWEDKPRFRYLFSASPPDEDPSRFHESDARVWTHGHGSSRAASTGY